MEESMPQNRHTTGFRGPSCEVGKASQFKPGHSGNPGGRPRAIISYWLRHELESLDPETQQEVAQRLVRVLVDKALAGDVRAIQVIADRVEGKPMQREDTDPASNEIKVVVEHIGGRPPSHS
jgi:hypothetical protein